MGGGEGSKVWRDLRIVFTFTTLEISRLLSVRE